MKTFYIKQKIFTITDRYFVYDEHQQPIYEVNGKFFTIGDELTLTNLKGEELYRIKQRVMSLFGAYAYSNCRECAEDIKQEIQSAAECFKKEDYDTALEFSDRAIDIWHKLSDRTVFV